MTRYCVSASRIRSLRRTVSHRCIDRHSFPVCSQREKKEGKGKKRKKGNIETRVRLCYEAPGDSLRALDANSSDYACTIVAAPYETSGQTSKVVADTPRREPAVQLKRAMGYPSTRFDNDAARFPIGFMRGKGQLRATMISPGIIIGAIPRAWPRYSERRRRRRRRGSRAAMFVNRSTLLAYQSSVSKIIDRRDNSKLTRQRCRRTRANTKVTNQSSQTGHAFSSDYVMERVTNIQGGAFVSDAPRS